MTTPLQNLYETHHLTGHRLGVSVQENIRGAIFSDWIGTNKQVLDLGCRDGTLTRHFIKDNHVIGCDIDANALRSAQDQYNIETYQVDLNNKLPFSDAQFDFVVMGEVLEHLPYWGITLPEVLRVLKIGGRLIGSIPVAYHLKDRWNVLRGKTLLAAGDPTHLHLLKYQDFIDRMSVYFNDPSLLTIEGGTGWKRKFPALFARNVAFSFKK